ncbi:collagen alpha-2(IX) chain-like [Xenia sp. Carnegie-2017]|uniref:collagen alpha-2(IX) chain-like n=1 Tax=Xenia sp. Carnegie-2017 TaxID=2897299 RepID=UPI001F043B58|nr:collagen alpha-2(IX) chain-like [Xenia sp. Carnegie-2017]
MQSITKILTVIVLCATFLFQRHFCQPYCYKGEPGPLGWPGPVGEPGLQGIKGEKGDSAYSIRSPPDDKPCYCPEAVKGEKGEPGPQGRKGVHGVPGFKGRVGEKGEKGYPGKIGAPGHSSKRVSMQPPGARNIAYVPVKISGRMPRIICHHFRRHAYVPVVPNKFVGWNEPGRSGYLTYGNWLYYSSRFMCPCSVKLPPGPTPSAREFMRRL